jgi:predicted dehydrogenase
MRLAFLGTGPDALALLTAAVQGGHSVVWLGEVRPEDADAVQGLVPHLEKPTDWELLLDQELADAVVVGRGTAAAELRAEQLKRLATDAAALLVVHPATSSVLTYYEVDMARRESGCVVQHFNPVASHPVVADLARWVREGHEAIGRVVQVSCDRALAEPTREAVLGQFARDAELLQAVAGDIRSTSAIGPRDPGGSYASLQVQMAVDGEASMRWSVSPASGASHGATLSLVGERGTITLLLPPDAASGAGWELCTDAGAGSETHSLAAWDPARASIESLAAAIASVAAEGAAAASTWDVATEAMEVADAAELSLQKGKSIDVHHQKLTEQLAFRGTMAALGCGVLTLGLAVLVVMTLLGGVEAVWGAPLVPYWPLVLFGLLAVFLLLQAVPLLVNKRK